MGIFNANFTLDFINSKLNNNMTQHLGIEYTEIGENYISGKMPVNEKTKQPMGLLHGGASVVLAESLGSIASNFCVDNNIEACVGLEVNANHLRSVREGYVYGTATAVHIGRKTHLWDIEITNENKKLVCKSRLTVAVVKKEE